MIIHGPRPNRDFTVIPNRVLRDELLSYRARGLLCYLLSMPPDWQVSSHRLTLEVGEGRDAVRAAIRELISNGHQVHIVTASSWPGAESYMNKSGAEFHVLRNKEEIPFRYDVAIGDSAWDIPMLKKARFMFCPKDAQSEVRFMTDMNILETKGGDGVMAEIVEIFIL